MQITWAACRAPRRRAMLSSSIHHLYALKTRSGTEPPRRRRRSPHPAPAAEGPERRGRDIPAPGVTLPGPSKQPKGVFVPSAASSSHQLGARCSATAQIPPLPRHQTTSPERSPSPFSYKTDSRTAPVPPGEGTDPPSLQTDNARPYPQAHGAAHVRRRGPKCSLGEFHQNPPFPSATAAAEAADGGSARAQRSASAPGVPAPPRPTDTHGRPSPRADSNRRMPWHSAGSPWHVTAFPSGLRLPA